MPAAIRIDIHMGSFGGLAAERSKSTKEYLDALASKLAEAVRACIMEHTNDVLDETEGIITEGDTIRPRIKDGLGDPWPPPPEPSEPVRIGDGLRESLDKLASGQWSDGLMPENAYDGGSRYIYIICDFG